jgi:PBP1b-binding outer membrane lipoprotein LpoB
MREKNLIDYHIVIQKNIVDDALIANVLSDLDISKEIESESDKISTALKIRTSKKFRLFNASANPNSPKKRKSIINSKDNDESLHSDLQAIIISKFHSINFANEVD